MCVYICVCVLSVCVCQAVSLRERKLGCLRLRLACIHSAEADAFHTYRYVLFPTSHPALAAAFKRTHVMLLLCAQVACCFISPLPANAELAAVRSHMVSYTLASGIVHRMNELFSLFDRPQVPAATLHAIWVYSCCIATKGLVNNKPLPFQKSLLVCIAPL